MELFLFIILVSRGLGGFLFLYRRLIDRVGRRCEGVIYQGLVGWKETFGFAVLREVFFCMRVG